MERVVITGMGAITPVGNDVPTFWESLKTGKCGIGPITKFDVSDFKVKLGAEVKDFDPTQYMEKREARRADANVHYAMAAAIQAVEQAGQGRAFYADALRQFPLGRGLVESRQVQQHQPARLGQSKAGQPAVQFSTPAARHLGQLHAKAVLIG